MAIYLLMMMDDFKFSMDDDGFDHPSTFGESDVDSFGVPSNETVR
jgi:hypothetical protein